MTFAGSSSRDSARTATRDEKSSTETHALERWVAPESGGAKKKNLPSPICIGELTCAGQWGYQNDYCDEILNLLLIASVQWSASIGDALDVAVAETIRRIVTRKSARDGTARFG